MQGPEYLILGCGYTARRVAQQLVLSGNRVICTNRHAVEIPGATCLSMDAADPTVLAPHLTQQMIVLNSIPSTEHTPAILHALLPCNPSRVVYISTTGVYGAAESVDEYTLPAPLAYSDIGRLQTENLIAAGPWSSLILRPAAIYGPSRGVHTSTRAGVFRPPPGGNRIISRIHVEDLANQVFAGLQSKLTGAFPIADEEPCTSLTVAEFAFELLGLPFATAERERISRDERKIGRRVDGSAYRRALNLQLRYPSYREGVPACLAAEAAPDAAVGPSPK